MKMSVIASGAIVGQIGGVSSSRPAVISSVSARRSKRVSQSVPEVVFWYL